MNIQMKPTRYPPVPNTLVHILQTRAMETPGKTAFLSIQEEQVEEKKLSYGELDRKAREIAATLQSFTSSQEKALLIFPPGLEFITALFGCLYAGVIAVPICPPDLNHLERDLPYLKNIIANAQANVILTNSAFFSLSGYFYLLASDFGSIQWLTTEKVGMASEYDFRPFPIQDKLIAILEYQAGMSKSPRSVILTHENLNSSLIEFETAFGFHDGSVNVSCLPPYNDIGLVEGILQSVFSGSETILLQPYMIHKDPLLWVRTISKYHANISGGPDYIFEQCVNQLACGLNYDLQLGMWTTAFIGSKRLYGNTLTRFYEAFKTYGFNKEAFLPYYGFIGSSLFVSGRKFSEGVGVVDISKKLVKGNYFIYSGGQSSDEIVGYQLDQFKHPVNIIDPVTGQPSKHMEIGEIVLNDSDHRFGSMDQIEEMHLGIRSKTHGFFQGSTLSSGDLGFIDKGYLFILGKINGGIKVKNRWFFPEDIEQILVNSNLEINQGNYSLFCVNNQDADEFVIFVVFNEKPTSQDPDQRKIQEEQLTSKIQKTISDVCGLVVNSIFFLQPDTIPTTLCDFKNNELIKNYFLSGYFKQKVI